MELKSIIRRLTPVECSRLMGFQSDDYLDIEPGITSDAPRYKACGNSWGVNSAEFVNTRIENALRECGAVSNDRTIQYATTCSGVEAHSQAVRNLAWNANFFSEIEPFPCKVLAKRYPHVPNLGDMTKVDGTKYNLDVFSGGTPCQDYSVAGKRAGGAEGSGTRSSLAFHWLRILKEANAKVAAWENVCFDGNTLVTTDCGHKKISDINVGDKVRSFDGKCHRVMRVIKTNKKNTIKIRAMGADDITVTPNHPFLARLNLHNKKNKSKRELTKPEWVQAGNLTKDHYIGYRLDEVSTQSIGMANAYAVGRWLADGSIALRSKKTHNGKRGGQTARIFISTGYKKRKHLLEELSRLPYAIGESKIKDYAINFTFTSDDFYCLIKDCGRGARNKCVPQYAYSLIPEEQKELLRGYFDGDGHLHRKSEMTYCSSSRELALGIARLVRDVYHRGVSIVFVKGKGKCEIDGRIVNAHDHWRCSFSNEVINCGAQKSHLISFEEDGFVWCPVKSISNVGERDVYNLTVAETHTYEVNDVVVHNCGAYSANEGRDFAWFVHRITESGYGVAWRVLDVQHGFSFMFPRAIPQRRKRIWLVAVKDNNWPLAMQILFERRKVTGTQHPSRILNDGQKVDSDDVDQMPDLFGFMGGPSFTKESRADWLNLNDIPKEFNTSLYSYLRDFGEVRYFDKMFIPGKEESPQTIIPLLLENIGAGAGVASGMNIATLTMPDWVGGMQLPWRERIAPDSFNGTVCGLSDILQPWGDYLGKYLLSKRACEGINRRAEARGKELPKILKDALNYQIGAWTQGFLDKYLKNAGLIENDECEDDECEDDGNEGEE